MEGVNEMRQRLIREFCEDYLEKVFYFCVRKTGSDFEAEDLASDITLNVVAALEKGTVPEHFSAWVWRIARNRYAFWAKQKRCLRENLTMDIDEYEMADDSSDLSEMWLHNEQLALLRRELAFISSDYRHIIMAYYLENRRVKDIAEDLELSESAVKLRLFRARKILKEGMNMAREFGSLSYNPENIRFTMNGMVSKINEPWCYLARMLCKNIVLAAYRTPSTAEELAIEVGVALPYMEDELGRLVDATLMRKNGDRYETGFFIVSAAAQEKIYAHLRGLAPELTRAIIEAREYWVRCFEENSSVWHEGYQPYEDMKWSLLMQTVDNLHCMVMDAVNSEKDKLPIENLGSWGFTKRPRDGEWDVLGYENYEGDRPSSVGLHGCYDSPDDMKKDCVDFRQFKFQYRGIDQKTPFCLRYEEGEALVRVARGETKDVPQTILEKLAEYGYLRHVGEGYEPTFLVMFKSKMKARTKEQEMEYRRLLNIALEIALRHYRFCREIVYRELPDFLKTDEYQIGFACANVYEMRGAVLEEALRMGYLTYEENDPRIMLGASLLI